MPAATKSRRSTHMPAKRVLRGEAAKRAMQDKAIDQTVAALKTSLLKNQQFRKGFLTPTSGTMPTSSWSNMGSTSSNLVAQVTQNLAAAFGRAPEEIELAMARQGLTWGPPFPPGRPLDPYFGYRRPPRVRDYSIGENVQLTPRSDRIAFATLKALWQAYDVAQICTQHLINDVRSLDYHFEAARGERGDVSDDIRKAYEFFDMPDKRVSFRAWLAKWLKDTIRYDSGPLYVRRTYDGTPYALEFVSGDTIMPLSDYFGRIATDEDPADPDLTPAGRFEGEITPAFLQIVQGMPWDWLAFEDVIYQPLNPEGDSLYGRAPLESVLLTSNTDLRFQQHFLNYFTEGSIPAGLMEAPEMLTDPEHIAEWQAIWDALMIGDQQMLRRIRWVPAGTKYQPVGPAAEGKGFDPQFPLYLMRRTCAAHGVTPADLGFTETVNKATSEVQVDVQFRVGTLPIVRHVEDIITIFCQEDLGLRVRLRFDTGREIEDRLSTAQAEKIYIDAGVISPDEPRTRLGYPIDRRRPVGRFIYGTRTGPVPLLSYMSMAGKIDPETFGPDKSEDWIDHPFVEVPGIAPIIGSSDYKNSMNATAALQANTIARGQGKPPAYPDDETTSPGPRGPVRSHSTMARQMAPTMDQAAAASKPGANGKPASSAKPGTAKKMSPVIAAGICVVAEESGRVLMLQRSNKDEKKKAAGKWEFPGGLLNLDEQPWEAAVREWQEETGNTLPDKGRVVGVWENTTDDDEGTVYRVFIYLIRYEDRINLNPSRGEMDVTNPDHPNAPQTEVMAWWDPELAAEAGKAIRKGLRKFPWDQVKKWRVAGLQAKKEGGAGGAGVGAAAGGAAAASLPAIANGPGVTQGVTAETGMTGVDLIGQDDDKDDDDEAQKAFIVDVQLRQWRENARNRLRRGQPLRKFVSADLPPDLVEEIWAELQNATTRQDVDRVFLSKAHPRPEPGEPEQGLRDALSNAIAGEVQRAAIRAAYTAIRDDVAKANLHPPSEPRARARQAALAVLLEAELAVERVVQGLLTAWTWAGSQGLETAMKLLGRDDPGTFADSSEYRSLEQRAEPIARGMANAILYEVADTIAFAAWEGRDEDQALASVLQAITARAALDAAVQIRRAHHVGRMDAYRAAGVQQLAWTGGACERCTRNAAASPIGINDSWPDGPPPVHPDCGCGVIPA